MNRLALGLIVFLVALPAAAGSAPVAHLHGGGLALDLEAPGGDADVIVEFQQPPLAVRAAPLQTYRDTFTRFRSDLAVIEGKTVAAKTAIVPVVDREYFEAFHGAAVRLPRAALRDLQLLPYVKRIHPNHEVQAFDDDSNTRIGADRVWSQLGSRGEGVVVAIIDTGVDYTHPALGGGIGMGYRVIGGYDFANNDDDPFDDNGHGTHVAGIVGASSSVVTGVAPGVFFLAYKVLGAKGSGKDSDVIAGIERALDPNNDGDLSDHADVANLSLGSLSGNPDDAPSTAVDNAVAAGMIVCVAAGNGGDFERIASPGMARNAITVGATDNNDALAPFSSRGPCAKLASIKPDVLAPGVSILSTLPNNNYGRLSGTSMASPQVAGAAALLRSLHRDWTPAQVKSALMGSSASLYSDVMLQGAGRIDVFRAAGSTASATPPQVSFGLDPTNDATFSQTALVTIANRSAAAQTFTTGVTDSAHAGVTLAVSPSTITLPANRSRTVTVTVTVDNSVAGSPPTGSFSFSGIISFITGQTTLQVPWAVVKATRATVAYDLAGAEVVWGNGGKVALPQPLDDKTFEAFLAPGDYDLLILSSSGGAEAPDLQTLILPELLDGDVPLAVTSSLASHHLDFEATDNTGTRLASYDTRPPSALWYLNRLRILPRAAAFPYFELNTPRFATMSFSTVSDAYTIEPSETFVDFNTRRAFQAQHRVLAGIQQDETFTANAGDYVHVHARLVFPSDDTRNVVALVPTLDRLQQTNTSAATFAPVSGRQWTPDVWLTPSPDPDRSIALTFAVSGDGPTPDYEIAPLRVIGGRVISAFPFVPPQTAFAASNGDTLPFGGGPLHPRLLLQPLVKEPFAASVQIYGSLDEWRMRDGPNGFYSISSVDGKVLWSGFAATPSFVIPALDAGAYRFDFTIEPLSLGDRLARGTVTSTFDTTRRDGAPPTITSLSLRDANDHPVSHLDAGAASSIVFSAADASVGTAQYMAVDTRATKLSIRVEGMGDWQAVPLTQIGEDGDTTNGRPAPGLIYRANLPAFPDGAVIDLKVDIADPAGNTTSWTLAPAFTAGNAPPFPGNRRRAG